MQPYFMPYIGYFQLIGSVDVFIVYDNVKYTKKGWINRNRMLLNGKDATFSLPLKKDSDYLDVRDRELAADFDRRKLFNQLTSAYRRAPNFAAIAPLLETILRFDDPNLFRFIHHSIVRLCEHIGVETKIRISSDIEIDHSLKSQDKVLALCQAVGATQYINPIGGTELYQNDVFAREGIKLVFLKALPFEYPQLGAPFVPWLSIVDVLMFNSIQQVSGVLLKNFDLVTGA